MNRLERDEERLAIFERDGWRCKCCGRSVYSQGVPQLAHLLANTESNRKKYGDCVIDHPDNRVATCSLYCNSKMNIGFKTAEAEELADSIRDKLLKE